MQRCQRSRPSLYRPGRHSLARNINPFTVTNHFIPKQNTRQNEGRHPRSFDQPAVSNLIAVHGKGGDDGIETGQSAVKIGYVPAPLTHPPGGNPVMIPCEWSRFVVFSWRLATNRARRSLGRWSPAREID